ncbi:hypothetical protein [Streptomyces sp. NPDC023838]|uniref:hypothetical protein n=1 Tax=Streptomyces sp. NPDC023838 TaxID=3154325 RepID=UPI0033FE5524
MTDPNETRPDSGSYRVPNGWGGSNADQTAETTSNNIPAQREWMTEAVRIPFPQTELYEIPDGVKEDGSRWIKTFSLTRSGPAQSLKRNLVIPGIVSIDAVYQPASLTERRTKSKTDDSNLNYTVRIELGDERPDPIVGTVCDEDIMAMGNLSGRWVRKLEAQHFIHSRQYQSLKYVIWSKARSGLKDGSLTKDEVFAETGMFRAIEPDPSSDGELLVFLTPGENGSLGHDGWVHRYKTELPEGLQQNERISSLGYRPANPETVKKSFTELFQMYDVTPKHQWIPAGLLGTTGIAPMYGIHRSAQVALAIVGPTKQGKTTLAKLVQPNQSATERGGKTLEPTINARSMNNGSTAFGIETVTSRLGGFVVPIDDMLTPQHMLPNNASLLRKALGNIEGLVSKIGGGGALKGDGFDPVTKAARLKKNAKLKTSVILTLEDFPRQPEYESVFNRMVVMTHDSREDISQDVLFHLWSEESEAHRFNAQCYYVQELMKNPELFDSAWIKAGELTDKWEFADFERERDNYRRILAGNIALLSVGQTVGAKGPSIAQVAGWLHDAAKLQSEWGIVETTEENDPLTQFRLEFALQMEKTLGPFTAPRVDGEKTTVVYPERSGLGPLEFHHIGYIAGKAKLNVDGQNGSDDIEEGSEWIKPMRPGKPVGTFVAWTPGRGKRPKFVRRFEFTTAEFSQLYARIEQGLIRRNLTVPSKTEFIRLMEKEDVARETTGPKSQGSPRVLQINADWLSQVDDYE